MWRVCNLTTTQEWHHKLRSSLHPGLFSLGYFIIANYMRSMPFDDSYTALALVIVPKIMQAGIAALSDWYAWRLGEKLYGRNSVTAWSVVSGVARIAPFSLCTC